MWFAHVPGGKESGKQNQATRSLVGPCWPGGRVRNSIDTMRRRRGDDRESPAGERAGSRSASGEPLALDGHRIVPAVKHEGSVRRWRCLDCDAEAPDAEVYLRLECPEEG